MGKKPEFVNGQRVTDQETMDIVEMVLGGLSATEEALFTRLPGAPFVPHEEVLAFVRRRRLARRGIGWVDAHLLASTLASGAVLWSVDIPLSAVATDLGVGFD